MSAGATVLDRRGLHRCLLQPRLHSQLLLRQLSESGSHPPRVLATRRSGHPQGALSRAGFCSGGSPHFCILCDWVTLEPRKTSTAVLPFRLSAPSSVYPFPLTCYCDQQRKTRQHLLCFVCRSPCSNVPIHSLQVLLCITLE